MQSTVDEITAFFIEARGLSADEVPPPELPLLESGMLDSLSMMEFIAFLEEKFGVAFSDDDIVPENFESVASVAQLIRSKQAAR